MTGSRAESLGRRFEDALVYAARVHAGQVRKGTGISYLSHLLAVAGLVLEDGGDDDEAIAAAPARRGGGSRGPGACSVAAVRRHLRPERARARVPLRA